MSRLNDWTLRPELMAVRPAPVSSWPSIADIPQGALVLDSDGVVKQCRYVANLDGADSIDFGFVLPANGTTGPWELEWLMAMDGMPSVFYTPFISMVGTNSTQHWRIQIDPALPNSSVSTWRNSNSSVAQTRRAIGFFDGKYHKHKIVVTSDLIGKYFVDGVQQDADAGLSAWAPGIETAFKIIGSAASGTKTFTRIANMVASRNGIPLANISFSEGVGTIANDKSGNGYNGTITDVSPLTFWTKTLVPVSLL